jgi:hypothetical protein
MTEFRFLPPIKKVEPKDNTVRGHRRSSPKNGPVVRPVHLDDNTQAAFNIAQQIEDLRQEIRWLEKQYRIVTGMYSDPNVDLKQLMFPFISHLVKVYGPSAGATARKGE